MQRWVNLREILKRIDYANARPNDVLGFEEMIEITFCIEIIYSISSKNESEIFSIRIIREHYAYMFMFFYK